MRGDYGQDLSCNRKVIRTIKRSGSVCAALHVGADLLARMPGLPDPYGKSSSMNMAYGWPGHN